MIDGKEINLDEWILAISMPNSIYFSQVIFRLLIHGIRLHDNDDDNNDDDDDDDWN